MAQNFRISLEVSAVIISFGVASDYPRRSIHLHLDSGKIRK